MWVSRSAVTEYRWPTQLDWRSARCQGVAIAWQCNLATQVRVHHVFRRRDVPAVIDRGREYFSAKLVGLATGATLYIHCAGTDLSDLYAAASVE